jgi:hypothetical protein
MTLAKASIFEVSERATICLSTLALVTGRIFFKLAIPIGADS